MLKLKTKAFTLLELIVVIVILGILAALAIPTFSSVLDRSKDETAGISLSAIARNAQALNAFKNDQGFTYEEVNTAVGETSYHAQSEGLLAAGKFVMADGSSAVTAGGQGTSSTSYGQVGWALSSDQATISLAMRSTTTRCVYVKTEQSGNTIWAFSEDKRTSCDSGTGLTLQPGDNGIAIDPDNPSHTPGTGGNTGGGNGDDDNNGETGGNNGGTGTNPDDGLDELAPTGSNNFGVLGARIKLSPQGTAAVMSETGSTTPKIATQVWEMSTGQKYNLPAQLIQPNYSDVSLPDVSNDGKTVAVNVANGSGIYYAKRSGNTWNTHLLEGYDLGWETNNYTNSITADGRYIYLIDNSTQPHPDGFAKLDTTTGEVTRTFLTAYTQATNYHQGITQLTITNDNKYLSLANTSNSTRSTINLTTGEWQTRDASSAFESPQWTQNNGDILNEQGQTIYDSSCAFPASPNIIDGRYAYGPYCNPSGTYQYVDSALYDLQTGQYITTSLKETLNLPNAITDYGLTLTPGKKYFVNVYQTNGNYGIAIFKK